MRLSWFYLFLAVLGAVIPWTFNWQAIQASGGKLGVSDFFVAGFANPIVSSLSADLLIGATAGLTLMLAEGRRLKMRWLWVYVVLTFLIAFACTFPLFLFFRERRLRELALPSE